MTDYAGIVLTGKSSSELLKELQEIRDWQGNNDLKIKVMLNGIDDYILADISDVEEAIKIDLESYIRLNFNLTKTHQTIKTGGNSDLHIVKDPNYFNVENRFRKHRNPMTHLSPKKKRRSK